MTGSQQVGARRASVPAPGPVAGVFSVAASLLLLSVGITFALGLLVSSDQPSELAEALRITTAGVAVMRIGGVTLLLGLVPGVFGLARHESPRWPSLVGIALGALGGLLMLVGYAFVHLIPGSF